jgi:trehalose-6-phosphatase
MNLYVDKLDGSYIDRRESSVVFNFSECSDYQFGHMVARELFKELEGTSGLTRVFGQTYIEAKPKELKKTTLLKRILSAITSTRDKIDFLLYIGEDSSNE